MAENYNDILKVGIGRVTAKVNADNYFPLVGDTVKIDAETKWGQASEWVTQSGDGESVTSPGNLAKQKDSKLLNIDAAGELLQKFVGKNVNYSAEVLKKIYAMQPQLMPYFEVSTDKEVVRVGEYVTLLIKGENGYPDNRARSIEARIYKENQHVNPLKTLDFTGHSFPNSVIDRFTFAQSSDRGVYDVEVDVTDTETGVVLSKRINKLITVVPKLCPKPTDMSTGYEVAFVYNAYTSYVSIPGTQDFECKLWRNVDNSGLNYAEMILPQGNPNNGQWNGPDISSLPPGTTLVVKRDPLEPKPYPMRMFVKGNKNQTETSENGTPNFTRESPLIITHDNEDVMQWGWRAYGAFSPGNNMRNIVIDGYGYHNTGIHFYPFDSYMFTDSCLYLNNGISDVEIFGIDVDGAGFAGVSAKTDPNPSMPWFWRESGWEMYLNIHHCTFRNTVGEGIYVGYFDTSTKSGNTASGEIVTYHAHIVRDLRIYRCTFLNNGYDSVQINNACGVEFCYNLLDGCGYRREPSQGSAFSCTMDGKIYNCVVKNNYNVIGVFGPFLSGLEIFNCILTAARLEPGWILMKWASDGNATEITNLYYHIHNNVVKAAVIARLTGNVSYTNYSMDDNIFITENGDVQTPGYFGGSGNVFITADLEYADIDNALKVADSANYNYQPAHNSPVVTAGRNAKAPFDMRGYKNWYIGNFHAGPFMGKYKDMTVSDVDLALLSVSLNQGATETYIREIDVRITYNGTPTLYRIGETPDLSQAAWKPIAELSENIVEYTLSEPFASKTVYAQVSNSNQSSAVLSASIQYKKEPISASMIINGGDAFTFDAVIGVKFTATGVYHSIQYMLAESDDFVGVSYADYTSDSEVELTLSSKGVKTVYARLKSDDGQVLNLTGTIEYASNKAICAFGYYKAVDYGLDKETGIFKMRTGTGYTTQLNNIRNEKFAQCLMKYGSNPWSATTPGNNSGIYPDKYLDKGVAMSVDNRNLETYIKFIELKNGSYKVRLLCNGNSTSYETTISSTIDINGVIVPAIDFLETFTDNYNTLIEATVEVSDGTITIIPKVTMNYKSIPINVIEIEEL